MTHLFSFTDEQWAKIEPLLPRKPRGVARVDDRRVLSGIVHVLKNGGRWADAPPAYGPKKTLYNRFVRWAERGVWKSIFQTLAAEADLPERLFLDSTFIKAHRCSGGAKGGPRVMLLASAGAAATPKSTR
jgi:transposase